MFLSRLFVTVLICVCTISLANADEGSPDRAFVSSEVGRLRQVLVHRPGAEMKRAVPLFYGDHSMLPWELLRDDANAQYAAFLAVLRGQACDVLLFEDVLQDAITQARAAGQLESWLQENVPALAPRVQDVTADMLLGRDHRLVYRADASGALKPGMSPATTLFFTRDLAVMTPRGLVLGNFQSGRRQYEIELTRFTFTHSAKLKDYPILWDATRAELRLQGGDMMVMDDRTLLVGVGNATDRRVAPALARAIDMDVIAIQMPSQELFAGEWDGLQTIFYHLDCLINFVDQRRVLAVPYLLDVASTQKSPLLNVLYGLARTEQFSREERLGMLEEVRSVGFVQRYEAGSGRLDASLERVKLLDYLRQRGYAVTYVGGPSANGAQQQMQHAVERVLRESRFMAANVVALEPSRIVSYDGVPHTRRALTEAGITVLDFPSNELVRANGGPHCLTLPLRRDP